MSNSSTIYTWCRELRVVRGRRIKRDVCFKVIALVLAVSSQRVKKFPLLFLYKLK